MGVKYLYREKVALGGKMKLGRANMTSTRKVWQKKGKLSRADFSSTWGGGELFKKKSYLWEQIALREFPKASEKAVPVAPCVARPGGGGWRDEPEKEGVGKKGVKRVWTGGCQSGRWDPLKGAASTVRAGKEKGKTTCR